MDQELFGTSLKKTFFRSDETDDKQQVSMQQGIPGPSPDAKVTSPQGKKSHSLSDIDVGYNLVRSMLEAKAMMKESEGSDESSGGNLAVMEQFLMKMGIDAADLVDGETDDT